jgi:diguanylate cyclase (GGDEF)-like protein
MIGLKPIDRTILTLGGIIILLICLSGLAVNEKLTTIIIREDMTGLYNKSYIKQRLQEEFYRSHTYNHPLSLLMIDLDNFKNLNDMYGHTIGDQLLKSFSALIKETIRPSDIAARYGGEEFLIILPETGDQEAIRVAERIHKKVCTYPFRNESLKGVTIRFTISIGTCSFPQYGQSGDELITLADVALYQAKREGKNRIASYGDKILSKNKTVAVS